MDDLKVIKKLYGEAMSHFCRDMFSTILEQKGALLNILVSHFELSRFLYQDIIEQHKEVEFKNYIYKLFDGGIREVDEVVPTPEKLLDKAGYTLYACKTEEDIQKFRKYYAPDEEICTFWTHRLNNCYVFFAVKKNVDKIKREDFKNPKREDLYGTSVISIQFSRDDSHILSIKNRYNHTVPNCDATFGNNLDNIIEGLTDSFAHHYGMTQKYKSEFELEGYVLANDGKYYKYNYEINNVYYCPDNIIIDNREVHRYEKEKYIILDYFVLDLEYKDIALGDLRLTDGFSKTIGEINNIKVENTPEGKKIIITPIEGEDIIIELDKQSRIVGYVNNNVTSIYDYFLSYNKRLKILRLPKVRKIWHYFCYNNQELEELMLERVVEIEDGFLYYNEKLKLLSLPNVKKVGNSFCCNNKSLEELIFEQVEEIGVFCLNYNTKMKRIIAPKLKHLGSGLCTFADHIEEFYAPLLERDISCQITEGTRVREK